MGQDRIKFINHGNQEILFLNFAKCRIDEVSTVIEEAKRVIRTRPEKSVLTLVDVTEMRFDDRVTQHMKEFTAHNKPYVRASAVIGVTGLKKIILDAVMLFSKRKFHTFDTVEQAKTWLAKN